VANVWDAGTVNETEGHYPYFGCPTSGSLWNVGTKRKRESQVPTEGDAKWATRWDPTPDGTQINSWQYPQLDDARWLVQTTWSAVGPRLEPVMVTVASFQQGEDLKQVPVTADVFRRLPLGNLQRDLRSQYVAYAAHLRDVPLPTERIKEMVTNLADRLNSVGGHKGSATSTEELQEVAAVYRKAWASGLSVTEAVREHFSLSESGAGKRIMKARAAHLLDDVGRRPR
jgi:hypothetical protein